VHISNKLTSQSNRLNSIRPSGIRKMFARAEGLKGVISLGIGKPDLFPPEKLLDEMAIQLKNKKAHGYTLNSGITELRDKITEKYKKQMNLDYERNSVVVGSGGTELLFGSIFAYTNPGDEVIIPDPGFVYYPTVPEMAGCKVKPIALNDEFQIPEEDLQNSISKNTKMIILNSPGNPSGNVYKEETIKMISDLAIDNEFIIFSDEVYEFIIFDGLKHHSPASYAPENTIILNSFSKTYCVTGWRLGYSIGNSELIKPLAKIHPFIIANAPSLPQYAIANFMGTKEDFDFQNQLRITMEKRRNVVETEFSKIPGISIPKVQGSFYAFPKIISDRYQSDNPGYEFSEDIFNNTKVVTVAGSEFGKSRNDHFRISFGSASEELIKESANRIVDYYSN